MKRKLLPGVLAFWAALCLIPPPSLGRQPLSEKDRARLDRMIGDRDALWISGGKGRPLFAQNADKLLIPASTIKVLTALAALHYLGPDFRFATEFYLDADRNLTVKGYGDPLLISEVIESICRNLGLTDINHIILDPSYFDDPIRIPGVSASFEPYDAPVGALCANFNTVFFKKGDDGRHVSAEAQTPLLPAVMESIRRSHLAAGRIVIPRENGAHTLYAGHLFRFFLEKSGATVNGAVRIGKVRPGRDRLIYAHRSEFRLTDVISRLFEYSNNFIANQLLICAGARIFGPPGTLEKGAAAAKAYARKALRIPDLRLVEGSGISRANRISAAAMQRALTAFAPRRDLMRRSENEFYKTGTLTGVHTRVGYFEKKGSAPVRYVLFINTPGKAADGVMQAARGLISRPVQAPRRW